MKKTTKITSIIVSATLSLCSLVFAPACNGSESNHTHNYNAVVTPPTCTEQGYTTHTCSSCGDSYIDNYTTKTDHSYINGVCENCGYDSNVENLMFTLLADNTYSIRGIKDKNAREISIPSTYNGKAVTTIGDSAFSGCTSLEKVELPNSITAIDAYAFRNCSSLLRLTIPGSVITIGENAFQNCSGLVQLNISDGVKTISPRAFQGCCDITELVIPDSVTSIGEGALSGFASLQSLTMPFIGDSLKTAEDLYQYPLGYIFGTSSYSGGIDTEQHYYGQSLTQVDSTNYYIPSGLTSVKITKGDNISAGAFYRCARINTIILPKVLKTIGAGAFQECSNLSNCEIPSSVTIIGFSAFWECSRLHSVTIPKGVKTIGDTTFYKCSNLASVTLPDGLIQIENNAFRECTNLKEIVIPDSVTSIGDYVFYECTALESVKLGTGISKISDYAFYDCYKLFWVEIPVSVTKIGIRSFYNCYAGMAMTYAGTKEQWNSITKGTNWNYGTKAFSVSCTADGEMVLYV